MSGEILFIAHRVPWPPDRGDRIRSWNVLKAIAALAPTHVLGFAEPGDDLAPASGEIGAIAQSFHAEVMALSRPKAVVSALATGRPASVCAFASAAMQHRVDSLIATRPIRAIYAFSGQMAQFVPKRRPGIRFIMDFVDIDSAKFDAFAAAERGVLRAANRMEARRLLAFEKSVARQADLSLFVSPHEAELFRTLSGFGEDRVQVLENGIDLVRFDPGLAYQPVDAGGAPLILFTGQMDYRPNIEAVGVFAREAMPHIRAKYPDAVFAIVGRAPAGEVKALSVLPGVLVTGAVPDTRDWLAAADVVVAPLRIARGVQNKVLEAMAMARPVVSSPQAAEGIDARAGRDLVVARSARSEARAVIDLLANPEKAAELGRAARTRMATRYGWTAKMAKLPAVLGLD